jgi:hypothetical protein
MRQKLRQSRAIVSEPWQFCLFRPAKYLEGEPTNALRISEPVRGAEDAQGVSPALSRRANSLCKLVHGVDYEISTAEQYDRNADPQQNNWLFSLLCCGGLNQ